jgi:hypothetical protein
MMRAVGIFKGKSRMLGASLALGHRSFELGFGDAT